MINVEEARKISKQTFNKDLFDEYLKRLDFLILRKAQKNETSAGIKVLTENYAIKLVEILNENGYRAKYVSGGHFGNGNTTYIVFCYWD